MLFSIEGDYYGNRYFCEIFVKGKSRKYTRLSLHESYNTSFSNCFVT